MTTTNWTPPAAQVKAEAEAEAMLVQMKADCEGGRFEVHVMRVICRVNKAGAARWWVDGSPARRYAAFDALATDLQELAT